MKNHRLERQFAKIQDWANQLLSHATGRQSDTSDSLESMRDELQGALNELKVIEEELRLQNDELRMARKASEAQRRRYRQLFDFAPDGYLVTDTSGSIREANYAAGALLHQHQEYLLGKSLLSFVADSHKKHFRLQIDRMDQMQRIEDWEVQLKLSDSPTLLDASITVAVVRDEKDRPCCLRWMIRDVSERKRRHEALACSDSILKVITHAAERFLEVENWQNVVEDVLVRLLDATHFSRVWVQTRQDDPVQDQASRLWFERTAGGIESRGPLLTDELGLSSREAIGHWTEKLIKGQVIMASKDDLMDLQKEVLEKRSTQSLVLIPIVAGTTSWGCLGLEDCRRPHLLASDELESLKAMGNILAGVIQRQSTAKSLKISEEHLMRATMRLTTDRLAGGIAHHFNNLLTVIMGNAQLLRQQWGHEKFLSASLEEIINASTRAAKLVKQLQTYAGRGRGRSELFDVNPVIRKSAELLPIGPSVQAEVRCDLQDSPAVVYGDPEQFKTALLQLGFNARDAMMGKGAITFTSEDVDLDQEYCREKGHEIPAGQYVRVSVKDTGRGMDAATLSQLFRPFYTTKDPAVVAGMGLASVQGFVKHHFGVIEVESELGKGTCVSVLLPLAYHGHPRIEEGREAEPAGTYISGRTGTILLVEDEEDVRQVARNVLEDVGYNVHCEEKGYAALEYYAGHHENVDLVIIDQVLPDIGGVDLFRNMKEINQEIRALLTSGYSLRDLSEEALHEGILGFIPKPFQIEEMLALVARYIHHRVIHGI